MFTPLDTRKPVIKTNIGWRRYTVLDDHITTRASSKANLGRYCTLLVASMAKRTCTVKEPIFLLTKLKTQRLVRLHISV